MVKRALSRRSLLRSAGLVGLASGAATLRRWLPGQDPPAAHAQTGGPATHGHAGNMVEGDVSAEVNGFDPVAMLTDFDDGTVSTLPSGQTLRDFRLVASEKTIEIAPGVFFPAWTYN